MAAITTPTFGMTAQQMKELAPRVTKKLLAIQEQPEWQLWYLAGLRKIVDTIKSCETMVQLDITFRMACRHRLLWVMMPSNIQGIMRELDEYAICKGQIIIQQDLIHKLQTI